MEHQPRQGQDGR